METQYCFPHFGSVSMVGWFNDFENEQNEISRAVEVLNGTGCTISAKQNRRTLFKLIGSMKKENLRKKQDS